MEHTLCIIVFCLSVCSFCVGEYVTNFRTTNQRVQYDPREQLEWSGYRYSLDEGHCAGQKLVDEDVKKDADPYTYKKTTYTWTGRGMFSLSCIRVLNRMPRDRNAAEARISDGGVGQGHVRIEMRSQESQQTHFHVEIWGQETRSQASNVAVMLNSPNRVLYMNGKKYCECR